jgi:hypothetical protein
VATSATTEAGEVDAYFNQLAVRFTGDRQVQAMRTADELALLITETVRQLPATAFRSQLFAEIEPRTLALWRSLRRAHASERNPLARIASQQPSAGGERRQCGVSTVRAAQSHRLRGDVCRGVFVVGDGAVFEASGERRPGANVAAARDARAQAVAATLSGSIAR